MSAMHTIPELDRKGLREFGITTGIIVVIIFGLFFPWLLEHAIPRRTITFLVSDMDGPGFHRVLQRVHRRHEVIPIWLRSWQGLHWILTDPGGKALLGNLAEAWLVDQIGVGGGPVPYSETGPETPHAGKA